MPRPRKGEKKTKPKEEKIVVSMEDTYSGIKKEDSGVIIADPTYFDEAEQPITKKEPKLSKRERIDKLLANPCKFYPDPTRIQWGTEMWPWLKQLADLLE